MEFKKILNGLHYNNHEITTKGLISQIHTDDIRIIKIDINNEESIEAAQQLVAHLLLNLPLPNIMLSQNIEGGYNTINNDFLLNALYMFYAKQELGIKNEFILDKSLIKDEKQNEEYIFFGDLSEKGQEIFAYYRINLTFLLKDSERDIQESKNFTEEEIYYLREYFNKINIFVSNALTFY